VVPTAVVLYLFSLPRIAPRGRPRLQQKNLYQEHMEVDQQTDESHHPSHSQLSSVLESDHPNPRMNLSVDPDQEQLFANMSREPARTQHFGAQE
jgi:hypothetical protein